MFLHIDVLNGHSEFVAKMAGEWNKMYFKTMVTRNVFPGLTMILKLKIKLALLG